MEKQYLYNETLDLGDKSSGRIDVAQELSLEERVEVS